MAQYLTNTQQVEGLECGQFNPCTCPKFCMSRSRIGNAGSPVSESLYCRQLGFRECPLAAINAPSKSSIIDVSKRRFLIQGIQKRALLLYQMGGRLLLWNVSIGHGLT
jgi:hypothetical protein